MTVIASKLGSNPLHRLRNRIASEVLEDQWKVNYLVNKKYLFKCIPYNALTCYEEDTVAVVVGAGPTLRKNLEHYDSLAAMRCHYFCTDKAFPILSKHVRPNYVTALNAKSPNKEVKGWWAQAPTNESILIMPITADPVTHENWRGRKCFVNCDLPIELTQTIVEQTGLKAIPGGSNVGVFSYLMATRLGYKNIILLGMDYSFETREQVIRKYSPGEPYIIFEHRDEKGNVRWSSWDWFDSAVAFFEYARHFRRTGVRTINCTEGGIIYDGEFIEDMSLEEASNELR